MKLLMITRRVDKDDGLAGFTYNWINKLSRHVEILYVVCLEKGNINGLAENIKLYSLGKEKGKNRLREFIRFQKLAARIIPKVDGVFTHQNPEYGLLIAPWTKFYNKRLVAWYTHKQVSTRLRILNSMVDRMLTASQTSFLLKSDKLKVLHHGIDTDNFSFASRRESDTLHLISISRISQTKRIHLMIDLVAKLKNKLDRKIKLQIVGEPTISQDKQYMKSLHDQVKDLKVENEVNFLGSVANAKTPALYQASDLFLNFSQTGSLDKAILEAMACGCLVLSSNISSKQFLNDLGEYFFVENPIQSLDNIRQIIATDNNELRHRFRQYVVDNHNLDKLTAKIIAEFK